MFFLSTYFGLEPSPSLFFVYLSSVWCFSPSPEKDSHHALVLPRLLRRWDYTDFFFKLTLWVLSCVVVSHNVAGFSNQYWLLLFFLRFQLTLGTASPWVGSDFSRIWCCLPRRWLTVNSPCSSWFSRSSFWGSDFYALFHSSRTAS